MVSGIEAMCGGMSWASGMPIDSWMTRCMDDESGGVISEPFEMDSAAALAREVEKVVVLLVVVTTRVFEEEVMVWANLLIGGGFEGGLSSNGGG